MSVKKLRRATKVILVIINSIIALSLILGCYGSHLDQRQYWFTGLFTIATPYLILMLLGFLVFWLFAKRSLGLISLSAIIICWLPIKEVFPVNFSQKFVLNKNDHAIRVMSWNVEHFDILEHKSHPERKQEMIELINTYQPDIACFQEMVASEMNASAINYLPAFIKQFKMYDYHYSFNKKLDFDNNHHFGIIILSKYPIVNKETITFNNKDYNSTFQFADVAKGKDTFRVYNIHLQSLKFTDNNKKYIDDPSMNNERDFEQSRNLMVKFKTGFLKRRIQSIRIKEKMNESPYPSIVCGDFNDVPNSFSYRTIGANMKNAFAEKGNGVGRTFYKIASTLRIDNIFVDEKMVVDQVTVLKKKLSDHFPLVADIEIRK